MHFCRICRTEKNLKYTVKELRKFSRRRSNDRLLGTTPTLGNICHECEERLHNFHSLDEHEGGDNDEQRIIVDDDELLYNLFIEKMEQQRIMKRLIGGGGDAEGVLCAGGDGGSEFRTNSLRQQTLVAATAVGVSVNGVVDDVIEVLTSRENTPSPSTFTTRSATPVGSYLPQAPMQLSHNDDNTPTVKRTSKLNGDDGTNVNSTATNGTTSISNHTATTITKNKSLVGTTTVPDKNKSSPYKVVAVIDLDDDDDDDTLPTTAPINSTLLTPQTTPDSDEEEIVFRKVEPDDEQNSSKYKRNKKNNTRTGKYQNRHINLIASLSLVSSDESDVEVGTNPKNSLTKPTTTPQKPLDDENVVSTTTTEQLSPPLSNCSSDDAPKTSTVSPEVKEKAHHEPVSEVCVSVQCPVCQSEFTATQRLIHHMRRKHRSYDGDELSERPRCAQDSAMTIRLRYMQRYNYYECQLCGCIDEVFKIHKEHIIQQHPVESKTLKDPMMQNLKCPVCKEKCGTQYIELLRHMLQTHKIAQCRTHFRQIIHIRNLFGKCSGKEEKELQRTARIYQITKRKQYYFECIQCRKIVTGYYSHVQHQKTHISKKIAVIKTTTTTKTKTIVNNTKKNERPKTVAAASSTPDPSTRRAAKPTAIENKIEKLSIVKNKDKDSTNKRKISSTQQICVQQKIVNQHQEQQSRRKRKLSKNAVKATLLKVKVKQPLKQLPTQRYHCNICSESFKGFHRLNLHIIRLHTSNNDDGILRCSICMLRFTQRNELEQHERVRHLYKQKHKSRPEQPDASNIVKQQITRIDGNGDNGEQRDKCSTNNGADIYKTSQIGAELQNAKHEKKVHSDVNGINVSWLQELLALAAHKQSLEQKHNNNAKSNDNAENAKGQYNSVSKKNDIAAAEQCLYCGHLFNTLKELHNHEYVHVERSEAKQFKRYSKNMFIPNLSTH
ncbi:zinc finger protein 252-like [Eurosta solidaginis]|uniref:zinc finger protein 252-like n=1 Tax=Eurosta solidaginis TaxID=178769 RepID=UPI0035308C6C